MKTTYLRKEPTWMSSNNPQIFKLTFALRVLEASMKVSSLKLSTISNPSSELLAFKKMKKKKVNWAIRATTNAEKLWITGKKTIRLLRITFTRWIRKSEEVAALRQVGQSSCTATNSLRGRHSHSSRSQTAQSTIPRLWASSLATLLRLTSLDKRAESLQLKLIERCGKNDDSIN